MTVNIPLSFKGNTGKKTVIEYVEDDVDELPDSYFSKAAARVFDKKNNGKAGFLPFSKFLTRLKHLGRFFIVKIWMLICRN